MTKYTPSTIRAVWGGLALCYVLINSSLASAGSPPSDNELKAAYCLKITQEQVALISNFVGMGDKFKAAYEKALQDEKRLRGYLLPKLKVLDLDALLIAKKRAEEDLEAHKAIPVCEKLDKEGMESLTKGKNQLYKLMDQCFEAIKSSESAKRVASCNDMTWLPF